MQTKRSFNFIQVNTDIIVIFITIACLEFLFAFSTYQIYFELNYLFFICFAEETFSTEDTAWSKGQSPLVMYTIKE